MVRDPSPSARLRMTTSLTHPTNDQRNFALGWTGFVMGQQLGGGSATEFFEFLCKLARDAELPIRHEDGARAERFRQAVGGFKKDRGFVAGSGCTTPT